MVPWLLLALNELPIQMAPAIPLPPAQLPCAAPASKPIGDTTRIGIEVESNRGRDTLTASSSSKDAFPLLPTSTKDNVFKLHMSTKKSFQKSYVPKPQGGHLTITLALHFSEYFCTSLQVKANTSQTHPQELQEARAAKAEHLITPVSASWKVFPVAGNQDTL